MHPIPVKAWLLVALAISSFQPVDAMAQDLSVPVLHWTRLGSLQDDQIRIESLRINPAPALLLRSEFTQTIGSQDLKDGLYVVAPVLDGIYNSAIPFSMNAGSLGGDKGSGFRVMGGGALKFGPLNVVAAPELTYQQNESFDDLIPELIRNNNYVLPWYQGEYSANLPLRPDNNESARQLSLGASSARLQAGPVSIGISNENRWWGPGIFNALLLSSNSAGFVHGFVDTDAVATPLGTLQASVLLGRLRGARPAGTDSISDAASLSAAAIVLTPRGAPNLSLGLARTVYRDLGGNESISGRAGDVIRLWAMGTRSEETSNSTDAEFEQLLSLFGRWVFPEDGLEIYAEWARQRLPDGLGEFLQRPGYSSGYTLGAEWLSEPWRDGRFRLQGEFSYLEQTPDVWRVERFYTSPVVSQGYTHDGKVVGATIGPGSSSQWFGLDFVRDRWRAGLVGGRIRWDNDGFYQTDYAVAGAWPYLNHDITVAGGIRAGFSVGPAQAEIELMRSERMNYLYQNWAGSWERSGIDAVDVQNNHLRLLVRF